MYYIYIKLANTKNNSLKLLVAIATSAVLALLYTFVRNYLTLIPVLFIVYFVYSIILSAITKSKFNASVIYTLISFVISYMALVISLLILTPFSYIIVNNIENSLNYIIGGMFQFLLVFLFFKIKRFRKGFNFLQNNNHISSIGGYAFIFIINMVLIINLLNMYWESDKRLATYVVAEFVIVGVIIVIWIWRGLTSFYQETMRERYIKEQEEEISKLKAENEKLSGENEAFSKTIHKYSKTLASMDTGIRNFMKKSDVNENVGADLASARTEFAEEYGDILDNIKNVSKDFSHEILQNKVKDKSLQSTNIFRIDSMLSHMLEETIKNNIDFNVKINGSIHLMIENVISESDLETLLGDHIKNAIIAVNSSSGTNRSILVLLGIIEDYYQIWIYDSGIEFETQTLLNLGLKRITTHAVDGGSGIGFMTSFEIFKKTNASLIIEEQEPSPNDYTKIIKIKFDGKNNYKIVSYRADEIKQKSVDNRIDMEQN